MNTELEIKTSFFPLAWFLYFVTPVIEINGKKHKMKWGTHSFDLPVGDYVVKIYFPYMGKSECGANEVKIKLAEHQKTKITYNMPPWMFAKGKIKVIN